ncbi:MAG TPA: ABC transporter permease [Gemmatimonadaceae bacterium]|jgi:ABC-type polysaccharide/polyol phosphate export permease
MLADLKGASIEVWQHRELLEQLTKRDIKLRYKQAAMGFAWAIFMPCLIVLSGLIIRFAMAQISGQALHPKDIANIAVKGVGWSFFVGALGFATASLIGNSNLVTKIYFPREVLPLSSVAAQGFDTSIGLLTLVVILPFLGVRLHASFVWIPLLLFLLVTFTTGVSMFLSCANLFFRDVKYIVQVVLMFGIFFTPIFFEPAMLGPRGAMLATINPLTGILEGLRLAVVDGRDLLHPIMGMVKGVERQIWNPWELVYSAVCAVSILLGSTLMFRRLQPLFAEYV